MLNAQRTMLIRYRILNEWASRTNGYGPAGVCRWRYPKSLAATPAWENITAIIAVKLLRKATTLQSTVNAQLKMKEAPFIMMVLSSWILKIYC